jgi:protein O-GlcNAc transferase
MKNNRHHAASVAGTALAIEHHRAGRLQEAEAIYRQHPLDPDALHLRGLIAQQQGLHEEAIALITKAIGLAPAEILYYGSLEAPCRASNRLETLASFYRQLLQYQPDEVVAHNNLGNALKDLGRLDEALSHFDKGLVLQPDFAIAHINRSIVLRLLGQLGEAVQAGRKAIELLPDSADAAMHLGHALREQGQLDEAALCYQQALALQPNLIDAHNLLGAIFKQQGKFDAALDSYFKALALKPDYAEAHNNLGLLFADQGKDTEAVECYRTALLLNSNLAEAHNNLGTLLRERRQLDDAAACFRNALAIRPDFADAHANLGIVLKEQGKLDAAVACYREAIRLRPGFVGAYHNLLLAMQYSASVTPEQLFAEHVAFADRFEAPLRPSWIAHTNAREPGKRLKIGYVSPDFRKHAVAYFIEPILAQHDRTQFEVFCYYNHTQIDTVTARLQSLTDHWVACKYMSDDELTARIRADGIDILIDLAGHTGGNRLLTFARKPAPVQVTYLGYPATTGLTAIDYRITDVHAEPVGMTEHLNVEQLWRLPDLFCCYCAADNSPDVIDHPPLQDNGFVTFGCFNNFSKVTDPVLKLWAKILQRVPNAKLMLEITGLDDPAFRGVTETHLSQLGLPIERLILMARRPENQYVLYNQIDIALDPIPCNGGTTSLDTLWMGVPFVALAGRHFTSRMGVTILANAGLQELIVSNEDEYVELAAALATDIPRLSALRDGLRERVQASPLMDALRFTQQLEQSYRSMWAAWCITGYMGHIAA